MMSSVFEGVHFGDDAAGLSGAGVVGFAVDHGEEAGAHGEGRDKEFAVVAFEGAAGEEGEEVDDVVADVFAAGEEAEVGVELRGFGVVVAGGDVDVAAECRRRWCRCGLLRGGRRGRFWCGF